jgi:hypothetical protein
LYKDVNKLPLTRRGNSRRFCESNVAVAVKLGVFRKPKKGERPPLVADTRGLVKASRTKTQ